MIAFELRRPFLLHSLLVVAAWLTYLIDPEDVVWRFIRGAQDARLLEHIGFTVAAAAIGAGILLGSWRSDRDFIAEGWTPGSIRRRCVGEILHGIGIASLVPVAGFVILVAGETIRSVRYARSKDADCPGTGQPSACPASCCPGGTCMEVGRS
jgi:hypothetical protein